MTDAANTMTVVEDILKEVIDGGGVVEQFKGGSVLLTYLKPQIEKTPTGKKYIVPLVTHGHTGIDVAAENEAIIPAGAREFDQAVFHLTSNYGRTSFTGQTIAQMESSTSAMVTNIVTNEMSAMFDNMREDMNRKLNGSGYGVIGRTTGNISTLTYTATARKRSNAQYGFGATFGTDYFMKGQRIQLYDLTTTSGAVAAWSGADIVLEQNKITAVTDTTFDVTADPSITEAANIDFFTKEKGFATTDGTAAESVPKEPYGLFNCFWDHYDDSIIDAAGAGFTVHHHFGGINRYTNSWWRGVQAHAGTNTAHWSSTPAALTSKDIRKTLRALRRRNKSLSKKDMMMLCTPEAFDAYGEYLVLDKRWGAKDMKLDGGFDALSLNGIPLVADEDCHQGFMFFVDFRFLKILDLGGLRWMNYGNTIFRPIADKDGMECFAVWYMNLICTKPSSGAVLDDIDDYDNAT
jgi:hypothetical protein